MVTLTEKNAITYIWAAFVVLCLGVLMTLLIKPEADYIFCFMVILLTLSGVTSYPEPRPKPFIFPNNRFLRWTFYSLYLFLAAHTTWHGWRIFFSG